MRSIVPLLFLLTFTLISSCQTTHKAITSDFTISDVYYQSWFFSENEKGTDIYILLKNVKSTIEFKTIIFRGQEIPVYQTLLKNKTILKAGFTIGISKIAEERVRHSLKENQLIYQLGKVNKSLILKNIRRKKTKYY